MIGAALAEKPRWLLVLRASLIGAAAFGLLHAADVSAAQATNPDFTKGESIPEDFKHDWNLGATGTRGWMFSDELVTSDARQIKITEVAKGSPAEGALAVGDVILGVGGKPFSYDPRTEFGQALDPQKDPRGMQQRFLARALFDSHEGLLGHSLDGVDRQQLYQAVRAGLKNEDGYARSSFGSVYRNLSAQAIEPLFPAILQAVVEPAPSGEMFADGIRVEGLRVLAKHRVEEGIRACVDYIRGQNPWASEERTPELTKILASYGANAKIVVPELDRIAADFAAGEPDFPKNLSLKKAASVREAIQQIQASNDRPELIRIH